jgi:Uma2 family endonuclease
MTAVVGQFHPPRLKKWTQAEYLDLIECGAFRKQRVYLFRGDIIEMAPHGHLHAYGITVLSRYLTDTYRPPYQVRIQLSFVTPGESVPEPDGAVCNETDAARCPHPSHAELVVEVASSSVAEDRAKAAEYAAARVPEYWIINTESRQVEVYRRPIEDRTAPLGFRYSDERVLTVDQEVSPADRPDAAIRVGAFFP